MTSRLPSDPTLRATVAESEQQRDAALDALVQRVPYLVFLGMAFERIDDQVTAILRFDERMIGNPVLPALHGGVTAALLESTALIELGWCRVREVLAKGNVAVGGCDSLRLPEIPKTIDFTIDYLRTGRPQDAYARAHVARLGRRYASVNIVAWQDDEERFFAQANGHFLMPESGFRDAG